MFGGTVHAEESDWFSTLVVDTARDPGSWVWTEQDFGPWPVRSRAGDRQVPASVVTSTRFRREFAPHEADTGPLRLMRHMTVDRALGVASTVVSQALFSGRGHWTAGITGWVAGPEGFVVMVWRPGDHAEQLVLTDALTFGGYVVQSDPDPSDVGSRRWAPGAGVLVDELQLRPSAVPDPTRQLADDD
jgi:hypothetical protein